MLIFPLVILGFYFVLLFFFIKAWHKKTLESEGEIINHFPKVSIVCCVRNEQEGIQSLLETIAHQDYPKELFECIIVDDFSIDNTLSIVEDWIERNEFQLIVLKNNASNMPKKTAISLAVSHCIGEIVLVTDGDCKVGKEWVSSHVKKHLQKHVSFVSASVRFEGGTFFEKVQRFEFVSLIASGAATIKLGFPTMANAANMSFKKKVFLELAGYEGTGNTPSGDDELLMHKIARKKGSTSIAFLQEKKAIVTTKAQPTIKALINQRRRWGSKWRFYQLSYIKILALFIFFTQLSILCIFVLCFIGEINMTLASVFLSLRLILEYCFLKPVSKFLGIRFSLGIFLFLQLFYPLYVLTIGVLSNIGSFYWKGRKY